MAADNSGKEYKWRHYHMHGGLGSRIQRITSALMSILFLAISLSVYAGTPTDTATSRKNLSGQIYLYGEQHAEARILEKEADLWRDYYHDEGLRHLFIEAPYYTAEFLNLWMRSDNDDILEAVHDASKGTPAYNPYTKAFYQRIKRECPETVFHGTDVGHQYDTTGKQFLNYLRAHHLEDSEQYGIAQDVIEQGRYYYGHSNLAYRENKLVENFVREFDALDGESVMGIYGRAHTGIDEQDFTYSVPSMANQLHTIYGNAVHTEDLTWVAKDITPERMDTITVAGENYQAAYFGKEDLRRLSRDYVSQEFWRLENAYDDFKDQPKLYYSILSYADYPMLIETGQVFVLDLTRTDGSVVRKYYRSDGNERNNRPVTEEFIIQ